MGTSNVLKRLSFLTTRALRYGLQWEDDDKPAWFKLLVDIRKKLFICPLCGDPTAELFISGETYWGAGPALGCIECSATLNELERSKYERLRRKVGLR